MRHWQPVRAIYKIASSTARKLVSRGRPNALRAGMEGSITAHSASVRSLAYRCPARSYFGRVISVHMLYLGDCSTQPLCYNHLKSLNSFPVSLSDRELPIWQECFKRHGTGEVYATIGNTVPTEFGPCNIYLAVENMLLQRYKPRLNNSHFR